MEVQILHYYLKVFRNILLLFLLFLLIYNIALINKNFSIEKNIIKISKGENIINVLQKNNISKNNIEDFFFKSYYKLIAKLYKVEVHYGDFYIENDISYHEMLKIITKPSNILNKITIVEGWSNKELDKELKKYFTDFKSIKYNEILADTYYFEKNGSFNDFLLKLKNYKKNYLKNKKNNNFFINYSEDDLMIIGSLIEKEGLDDVDKRKISSVIMNRIDKKMKLQIDATVLYALTDGKYNLERELSYNDLKFEHPYNTYIISKLPPGPISYVGKNTVDIILENYSSEFLFYFYNKSIKKHIFSKDFENHKKKLKKYRNE